MHRYFDKKTIFILIFSSLFLMTEGFVSICETDFIRAMMMRAAIPNPDDFPNLSAIMPKNILYLYNLGLLNLSLLTFGVLIGGCVFGGFGVWTASKFVAQYTAKMRYEVYKNIQSFSFEDIDKFSTSSLVTRITTDVEITNVSLSFVSKFVASGIFSIIFGIVKSCVDYKNWAIVYSYVIPILIGSILIVAAFAMPNLKKGQIATDGINKQVRETILGIRVVKAYNLEKNQKTKFEKPNEDLTRSWKKGFTLIFLIMPIIQCIINGVIASIYFITFKNNNNFTAASEIIGFLGILMQVLFGFIIIIISLTQFSRAIPCIKRINEVVKYKPTLIFNNDSKEKITNGKIEFINVSHSFLKDDEHLILKNINIKINPKERIGIIGGTGSGKSTFINLIGRLFDSTKGTILIDGIDIKKFSFDEINSNVAIAMQTATLFSGTIKSNIAFGLPENMNDEELTNEIIKAAKAAEAWEFISKKEGVLDGIVEQRGKNFSGGQKQRISIARTIAKKSKIVIFDDSTSALDTVTERKVQKNIKTYNDATTIIVAQRISSVEEMDKIIVMDNGQIVGFDSHWNLLSNNDYYRSIAASQIGTEELNNLLKERGLRQIEKK